MHRAAILAVALAFAGAPALAQTIPAQPTSVQTTSVQAVGDRFTDATDGGKVHASGFVCPPEIADFERDAVGEQDADSKADFCAYSALDGVYGTITLVPLAASYDPKDALAAQFTEQEGTGGKQIGEAMAKFGGREVYTRTYETTSLEDLSYRILFAGVAVNGWALEATVEFATPRDDAFEQNFLDFVYGVGAAKIDVAPLASTRK